VLSRSLSHEYEGNSVIQGMSIVGGKHKKKNKLKKKQSGMYEKEREDQIKLHILLDSDDCIPYALTEEDKLKIKEIDFALGLLTDREVEVEVEKDLYSVCDPHTCQNEDDQRTVEDFYISDANSSINGGKRENPDPGSRNLSRKSSSSTMREQQQQGLKSRISSRKTSKCTVGEEKVEGSGPGPRRKSVESQAVGRIEMDETDGVIRSLNRRLGDSYLTNQVPRQDPRSP
jgi:hypothetical protein